VLRSVLAGADGPAARVVLANAAAALVAAGRVPGLRDGVALARVTLASGQARRVLDRLAVCSREADSSKQGNQT
jgi:anthranilate phosphoribosyltransferase